MSESGEVFKVAKLEERERELERERGGGLSVKLLAQPFDLQMHIVL